MQDNLQATKNNNIMSKIKTNSLVVMKAVRAHIIESVTDEDGENFSTLKDACTYLNSEFDRVANYPYNVKRFPNDQDRFEDYLRGIQFYFHFSYEGIQAFLNGLGINPENKKYSGDKMWRLYSYLVFREMKKAL